MSKEKKTGRKLTQARKEANARYNSKFVEVKVRMTPERRTVVQEHASSMEESTTAFINRAIDETMARDQEIIIKFLIQKRWVFPRCGASQRRLLRGRTGSFKYNAHLVFKLIIPNLSFTFCLNCF